MRSVDRKPLTYSEAADCVDEANAISSGLRLDEIAAMLRSLAAGPDPDRQPVHKEPNKSHTRRYAAGKCT